MQRNLPLANPQIHSLTSSSKRRSHTLIILDNMFSNEFFNSERWSGFTEHPSGRKKTQSTIRKRINALFGFVNVCETLISHYDMLSIAKI